MTAEQMRAYLLERYPGSVKWARRVATMSDQQVFAIYMRLKNKAA